MPSALLALPDALHEGDGVAVVFCGVCFLKKQIEPAGRAFHSAFEKPIIDSKKSTKGRQWSRAEKGINSDDEVEPSAEAAWKRKKKDGGGKGSGALRLGPLLQGENLYSILDVDQWCSADQLKKAYRRLVLIYHPDKQDGGEKEESRVGLSDKDQHFVRIQEAYEVLSDVAKRRQYDSTLEFDNNIPDDIDDRLGFFGTFGPVFQRNARWSIRTPVPDLGDESTDISKVHKFYDFWFSFESWRDFSIHDEFNLDDAEVREERRWMERQNKNSRKKYEIEERRRVLRLTESAERLDPRIRAEREEAEAKKLEEKNRRARAKQEKEEEKLRLEEERGHKLEQARLQKEEQERAERELRKQDKQALKTLRQRLKKSMQGRCANLSPFEREELQSFSCSLNGDQLEDLCNRLENLPVNQIEETLKCMVVDWRQREVQALEEQSRRREHLRRQGEQERAVKEASPDISGVWSTEELGCLAKALQKFPGGLGGRWAQIAKFMHHSGYERSEKEVVSKAKELSDGRSLRAVGATLAPSRGLQTTVASSEVLGAPCIANGGGAVATALPDTSTKTSAKFSEPSGSVVAEWTSEQQRALEGALQKYPATLEKNERWRLITEDVPGKTKAQCVERFKFLCAQISKQG